MGLDPHSVYLTSDAFENLQSNTSGEFSGLGLEVGMEDGYVKIISPIDGSPAAEAGKAESRSVAARKETARNCGRRRCRIGTRTTGFR